MNAPIAERPKGPAINGRQLCFFAAFMIPVSKFSETPATLSYYAKGDLLLPALVHYILQGLVLAAILYIASRTDKTFYELLSDALGKVAAKIICIVYALYLIFSLLLPALDLDRFVCATFFDSEPCVSTFVIFFFLSAFVCMKNVKALGRCADICMPLFLVSFVGLMALSVGEADFTNILPLLGTPPKSTALGFLRTWESFSDTALFLPLLGFYRYERGDAKKVIGSYALGGLFVLFFLAVFYGIFGALAPNKSHGFTQTAQYFTALSVVGRFDLLLVYLMTVVLLFYYCIPLQLSTALLARSFETKKRLWISIAVNLALLATALFVSEEYNAVYHFVTAKLFWIFPLFSEVLPLLSLLLLLRQPKRPKKEKERGQGSDETEKEKIKEKTYA